MRLLHTADWHLGRLFHNLSLLDDQRHVLQQLLTIIDRERVDAVLLACPFSHVSGSSMGSQLLTLAACARLPVLALFESQAAAQTARTQVEGITDFLIKPLRFEDLQQALAQRLLTGDEDKSVEF